VITPQSHTQQVKNLGAMASAPAAPQLVFAGLRKAAWSSSEELRSAIKGSGRHGRSGNPHSRRIHCGRGSVWRHHARSAKEEYGDDYLSSQEVGEQRFLLSHVSWESYESLLADYTMPVRPVSLTAKDAGNHEPVEQREEVERRHGHDRDIVAEEQQVEFKRFGSTTFRRRDLKRGTEPDECFYIEMWSASAGTKK